MEWSFGPRESSASKAGSLHRRAPGEFCPKEQMPRHFINITQGEQIRELAGVLISDLRQSCLNKRSFGTKVSDFPNDLARPEAPFAEE
jgi:hypothetical protein